MRVGGRTGRRSSEDRRRKRASGPSNRSLITPGNRIDPNTFAGVSNTSNRFLQALDACDFDAFVDTFVSDGVWAIKDRPEYEGRDGLQRFWDNRSPKAVHRKHLLNGLYIVADDGEIARIEVVISIIDLQDGATVAAGNSTDELRRCEDEIWRFVRKQTGMLFKNL